ncbi:MAG: preprotein translocase subunit YajC [Endomicrobium sp.]|jgi:preprotein translocase subunit YajC|nr:preprotein translocase subunit YajC [Endomicrobium sp.]
MKKITNVSALFLMLIILMTPSLVFARTPLDGLSSFSGLVPLGLIFVFFYLFLIRPQQKKAKQHQNVLNALKKDDRIITIGGLYATVGCVNGDIVEAKIADGVYVQIAKRAISTVIAKEIGEVSNNES